MSELIPTPWHAQEGSLNLRGPATDEHPLGKKIGHIQGRDFAETPEDFAHLSLIVRAVNSHEDLAAASLTSELRTKFASLRSCILHFVKETDDIGRMDDALGDALLIEHILECNGNWQRVYDWLHSCHDALEFLENQASATPGPAPETGEVSHEA
jgi:hypothetical protein